MMSPVATETVEDVLREKKRTRIKHIRLPDDPNTAWCGFRRRPGNGWRYWHEVDEADICVVCLSFPGAREYGMGT